MLIPQNKQYITGWGHIYVNLLILYLLIFILLCYSSHSAFSKGRFYSNLKTGLTKDSQQSTIDDSLRTVAQNLFKEKKILQKQNNAKSFHEAIEKFNSALQLWQSIGDTTELMKRFFQYMLGEKQLPVSAALQKAQISIMNEKRWQSPYY